MNSFLGVIKAGAALTALWLALEGFTLAAVWLNEQVYQLTH